MEVRRRPLRVLQMIGFLSGDGGAERLTTGLVTHFPKDRIESWVCAPRGGEPGPVAALAQAGVPFVDLGRRRKHDYHRLTGLLTLLRRERFDVVHTHLFGSNLWGALAARAAGVPVVIAHEHTWSYQGDPVRVWLDGRLIGRLVDRFLADCSADARKMIELEKVPPRKVKAMPTAYIPRPAASNGDLRTELGLPAKAPLIGTAVVFRPQKALEVLLEAHARTLTVVPDAHLALAGDGPCSEELRRRAQALGIAERTHFLGRRDDVEAILDAFDVAAMSSDYEGTPLFALECMARGTPLVATAVGGLPDVIEDGVTGLLVPPRAPEQLADGITSLLLDPERRAEMGGRAFRKLAEFTIERRASEFVELYEQLAAEAGVR